MWISGCRGVGIVVCRIVTNLLCTVMLGTSRSIDLTAATGIWDGEKEKHGQSMKMIIG